MEDVVDIEMIDVEGLDERDRHPGPHPNEPPRKRRLIEPLDLRLVEKKILVEMFRHLALSGALGGLSGAISQLREKDELIEFFNKYIDQTKLEDALAAATKKVGRLGVRAAIRHYLNLEEKKKRALNIVNEYEKVRNKEQAELFFKRRNDELRLATRLETLDNEIGEISNALFRLLSQASNYFDVPVIQNYITEQDFTVEYIRNDELPRMLDNPEFNPRTMNAYIRDGENQPGFAWVLSHEHNNFEMLFSVLEERVNQVMKIFEEINKNRRTQRTLLDDIVLNDTGQAKLKLGFQKRRLRSRRSRGLGSRGSRGSWRRKRKNRKSSRKLKKK